LSSLLRITKLAGAGLTLLAAVVLGNSGTLTVCVRGCDFPTIQAAIDAAKSGDTIEVKAGSYQENIVAIRKNLTLKGEDASKVTLTSKAEGKPVILIEGDQPVNVVVSGFTITGAKGSCVAAIKVCPFGVSVFGNAVVTLQKNRLLANKYGTVAGEESQMVLIENIFTDNETAIMLRNHVRSAIQANRLKRNQFGILIGHSTQTTIKNNNISGSDRPIRVWDQSRAVIENNRVSRNKTGLLIKDKTQAVITLNTVTDNESYGFLIWGQASVSLQENTISGNVGSGIILAEQATAEILRNKVTRNQEWGISIWIRVCEDQATADFSGKITGKSNQIPGPSESQANHKGDVCPSALQFLKTDQGGKYP
jgi:parallel beta-helix repeat protein